MLLSCFRKRMSANRVGSADVADVAVAAAAEEGENDMMKSVDAVTTIKVHNTYYARLDKKFL